MIAKFALHSGGAFRSCFHGSLLPTLPKRLFGKSRVVLDTIPSTSSKSVVELNAFNKIRDIAKRAHLPLAHVTKALCVREGKNFVLNDVDGTPHFFRDERDVVVPYEVASTYLESCQKVCRRKEIDPEYIEEDTLPSKKMGFRSSVFSVVGEMDHGKTTLLDYLQHSEIQKKEFGGTTQLIRANSLTLEYRNESNKVANYPCTFLDTPGQSCFADLRGNGSVLSDLSLYIVSLYEGPTEEAHHILNQLKSNDRPVVVVFTKRDMVSAEREKEVREVIFQLASQHAVPIVESFVISSKTGEGLPSLQQHLVTLGKELRRQVPLDHPAEASVLDSLLLPSQGLVFRTLVQQGTLSLRDHFICGMYTGRVRKITDLNNQAVQKALPGMVVNVMGARKLPTTLRKNSLLLPAGNTLFVRTLPEIEAIFDQRLLEYQFTTSRGETEEESMAEAEAAIAMHGVTEVIDGEEYVELKKQSIILVGDNSNSINVLLESLLAKPNVSIARTRVGQILESDVEECKTTDLKIVSFNVNLPPKKHLQKDKFVYSRLMSELLTTLDALFDPSV